LQVAKEQAERRATAKQMFDMGQRAYGKGMYGRSIEFLEAALTIIRPSSLLGGEVVSMLHICTCHAIGMGSMV
jgi:hypothetical protein